MSILKKQLEELKSQNLYRFLKTIESDQSFEIIFEGKKYLNFSSNNYLGLANHPFLKEAAIDATQKFGTSSGASRLITGSMSLHQLVENKIAQFKASEKALVFNSGYHANLGVIPALMGKQDSIFSDELNHASIIDGCRLAGSSVSIFKHNDVNHLEFLLKKTSDKEKKLIAVDSVFSMDGDLAPLDELIKLAEKYDAYLYVDEAHATGVFGKTGRGVIEHFNLNRNHPNLIQMGTFGKALGSFGAYVCGSSDLIEYLINKSRTFIFTTSLPPSVIAANFAVLDLIEKDTSFKNKLWENVFYLKNQLSDLLKNTPYHLAKTDSPILPIIIGDEKQTLSLSQKLFEKGIWATAIRPPTVPQSTSRIRLTVMASHLKSHLDKLIDGLKECFDS